MEPLMHTAMHTRVFLSPHFYTSLHLQDLLSFFCRNNLSITSSGSFKTFSLTSLLIVTSVRHIGSFHMHTVGGAGVGTVDWTTRPHSQQTMPETKAPLER